MSPEKWAGGISTLLYYISKLNFVPVKKLAAIIMIMLYGLSSTGATVQFHYCCGKLKSVKLSTAAVKECGGKQKMGSKPCCETKQVSSKSHDQQQDVYTISFGSDAPVILCQVVTEVPVFHSLPAYTHQQAYLSPPLSKSLLILNCVFRI
jgi:hypothetical protein